MKYKLEIQKAIVKIQNPNTKSLEISTYKDFLRVRNFLHLYKYNPKVIKSLLVLAINVWNTENRINRPSLISTINRYYKSNSIEKSSFDEETNTLLFNLFCKTIFETSKISETLLWRLQISSNSLVKGIKLNEIQIEWLLNNYTLSEHIFNRILRYPYKNQAISNFVKQIYNKDEYRSRRAELTSWLLDDSPNYVIDDKVMFADFYYMNQTDKMAIDEFIGNKVSSEMITSEMNDLGIELFSEDFDYNPEETEFIEIAIRQNTESTLLRRHYKYPISKSIKYQIKIPNFDIIEDWFTENLEYIRAKTMIWAIEYSRLSITKKTKLFDKYYSERLSYTFMYIARKRNDIKLWKWLLTKN